MCGLVGYVDLRDERPAELPVVHRMADMLAHRGPDSAGAFVEGSVGLGFRRLSIIDLEGGDQPLYSEDGNVVLCCNGEIFNHRELRAELVGRGHAFRSGSDVEVVLHLYEEFGCALLDRLNGQFSFALYDRRRRSLLLARDPIGVTPLYWAVWDGVLVFASEVKAMLEHPLQRREVDLTGLDQVLSFPGLVSPRTVFRGVSSLPPGHRLVLAHGQVDVAEYWDLEYPPGGECGPERPESWYTDRLAAALEASVQRRLQADVPVGLYLSGGLDSSLIAGLAARLTPGAQRRSFSVSFDDGPMCEGRWQRLAAAHVGSEHHEIPFGWSEIEGRLRTMVRHCECPVKESYNTCSLALSQAARAEGVPVILSGEGADELFAGYVGYRFDASGARGNGAGGLEQLFEEELRERLWGSPDLFYESDYHAQREANRALYSAEAAELHADFDCLAQPIVKRERLAGRHPVHQRSYLDFKLRLSDHLLSDHGDRMALAHSVETRYPYLDREVIEVARITPPELKLKGLTEKHILKRVAERVLPHDLVHREKFGFHAPGSPFLLRQSVDWINDLLSPERIRRQGYFEPVMVERLRARYVRHDFRLNLPFETDVLMVVLTFGILLDEFRLPSLN